MTTQDRLTLFFYLLTRGTPIKICDQPVSFSGLPWGAVNGLLKIVDELDGDPVFSSEPGEALARRMAARLLERSVQITPCTFPGCVKGQVTSAMIDSHCCAFDERPCGRCEGRGYLLPEPGVYRVRVADKDSHGKDYTLAVVEDDRSRVSFNGSDWDMSTEFTVEWLEKLA